MIGELTTPARFEHRKARIEKIGLIRAGPRRVEGRMLQEPDEFILVTGPYVGDAVLHDGNGGFVIDGRLRGDEIHEALLTKRRAHYQHYGICGKLDKTMPAIYIERKQTGHFMKIKQNGTLSEAFAQTDNIAYGPFKIEKQPGKPWETAVFTVNNHKIELKNRQMLIIALLISQKGEIVRHDDVMAEIGIIDKTVSAKSSMKVHISKIKSAIKGTPDGEYAASHIQPYNKNHKKGLTDKQRILTRTGYHIVDPSP